MSVDAAFPSLRERHYELTRAALRDVFVDQEADVVVAGRSLGDEWDARLAQVIYTRNRNTATDVALRVADALGAEYDPEIMDEWLTVNANLASSRINGSTRDALAEADDKAEVFRMLMAAGVAQYALSMTTTAANFGAHDAAVKSGAATKTWLGGTTRHGHMNGETVPLSENFSNGMAWPGDPDGGAGEVANCGCSVQFD